MVSTPCPHCGKTIFRGVPICRWCKTRFEAPGRVPRNRSREMDPEGRPYLGPVIRYGFLGLAAVAIISALAGRQFLFVPALLAMLLILSANVAGIAAAFRLSFVWGLAVFFIPGAFLLFILLHSDDCVPAVLLGGAGILLILMTLGAGAAFGTLA